MIVSPLFTLLLLSLICQSISYAEEIEAQLGPPLLSATFNHRLSKPDSAKKFYEKRTALIFLRNQHGLDHLWCMGSIIAKDLILTSASCVIVGEKSIIGTSYVMGVIPNYIFTRNKGLTGTVFVETAYVHKDYAFNIESPKHDVAILKLQSDIESNSFEPVRLRKKQRESKEPQRKLVSIGFPKIKRNNRREIVKDIAQTFYRPGKGNKYWCESNGKIKPYICTYDSTVEIDPKMSEVTCIFDEGGPLFIRRGKKDSGKYSQEGDQIGISNFGNGCKKKKGAEKFTSLFNYVNDIRKVIKGKRAEGKFVERINEEAGTEKGLKEEDNIPKYPPLEETEMPKYIENLRKCTKNHGQNKHIIVIDSGCTGWNVLDSEIGCSSANTAKYEPCYDSRTTHGTQVSSLIGHPFLGVSHKARVTCIDISTPGGYESCEREYDVGGRCLNFSLQDLLIGLKRAHSQNPDVINLSVSWDDADGPVSDEIIDTLRMISTGTKIVLSSGDRGLDSCTFPSKIKEAQQKIDSQNVYVVGALKANGKRLENANKGDCTTVWALGHDMHTLDGLTYGIKHDSGSSFAAPLISGIIANYLSDDHNLTEEEIEILGKISYAGNEFPCPGGNGEKAEPDSTNTGDQENRNLITQAFNFS